MALLKSVLALELNSRIVIPLTILHLVQVKSQADISLESDVVNQGKLITTTEVSTGYIQVISKSGRLWFPSGKIDRNCNGKECNAFAIL